MADNRSDERDPRDDARDPWRDESADSPDAVRPDSPDAVRPDSTDAVHPDPAHPAAPRDTADAAHRSESEDTAYAADPTDTRVSYPEDAEPGLSYWAAGHGEPTQAATVQAAPVTADEPQNEAVRAERDRLVAERAARKEARLTALNPPPPPPVPAATPAAGAAAASATATQTERVVVTKRSTDAFAGALGLFVLRLVTAAIVGVHGVNHLLNLPATTETLQNTVLPMPALMAILAGAAEVGVAILLVFGLLTRVAGLGLIGIAGGALAFLRWGAWSPFRPGQTGFVGELELLLVAVGLLFLLVGGGGWSVDRGFRARREADRAARAAA